MIRIFFLSVLLIVTTAHPATTMDRFCQKVPSWYVNSAYYLFEPWASENITRSDFELLKSRRLQDTEHSLKYFTIFCPEKAIKKTGLMSMHKTGVLIL